MITQTRRGSQRPDKKAKNTYRCPYTTRSFQGTCPVTSCPASIKATRHPSGCLHNCFPAKDVGIQELAFAFNRDPAYLKARYDEGIASLKNLLLFQRFLEWVRVRATAHSHCVMCGAVQGTNRCALDRCGNKRFVNKILKRYPFNIPQLEVTKQDLGLLVHYRDDLARVFKENFLTVTGLTPDEIKQLHTNQPHTGNRNP